MPGAGDAPRARGVRARGRVSDGGDVCEVSPGRNDHSETLTSAVVRARRVGLDARPPDSWIRVVVDTVLLDDAPFEPPEGDAASARASENFRSAGGEPRETVRVLTAVLRTVTDGRDRLLPLVASAFVLSPADDDAIAIETSAAMPEDTEGTEETEETEEKDARVDGPERSRRPRRPERPERSVPDAYRRPYVFAPPPRAPRPTSRAQRPFGGGDRSASSRVLLASRDWPPAPARPRRDPLGMCFEYLNNCMRPAKRNRKEARSSRDDETNAVSSDAATFTAYGSDRSGAGMHQDVDAFDSSGALETARAHLEDTFASDDAGGEPSDAASLSVLSREPHVEPRDVDDMLDALEDRVGSAYVVVDVPEHTETRGATIRRNGSSVSSVSTVSASARLAATLYATPRDGAFFERADEPSTTTLREVRFETKDWLGFENTSRRISNASDHLESESEIVNLESFLALCAASRRNLPMYVARDVADAAGIAPFAWRPSFRSVRRMSDPPAFRRLATERESSAGRVTGSTTQATRLDADLEAHFEENAIGALFESFLRGVAESVADAGADAGADAKPETTRLQSLIDGNVRGVPLASSDSARNAKRETHGSSLDLGEALLGGPVVFFRAAMRAWAGWYRKTRRTRKPESRAAGDALAAEGLAIRRTRSTSSPPPSADALRRLTGKRGDLATNAFLRSRGPVGTAGTLDRRTLDCVVAHRMTIAAATTRRRYLAKVRETPEPKHVIAATLLLDSDDSAFSFRDADPDAKPLVASWARRAARAASDAEAYAENARALDETVGARAAEVDECARATSPGRAIASLELAVTSPGRAIASLELAVSEERWADAARWRDALRRANGRCADHEAVFGGSEPGEEDGYDAY